MSKNSIKSFCFVLLVIVELSYCTTPLHLDVWTVTSELLNQTQDTYCSNCFHLSWILILNTDKVTSSHSNSTRPQFHDVSLILDHPALINSSDTFIIYRNRQTQFAFDASLDEIPPFPAAEIKRFNATSSRWPGVVRIDLTDYFRKLANETIDERRLFFSISRTQPLKLPTSVNFKNVAPIIVASRQLSDQSQLERVRRSLTSDPTSGVVADNIAEQTDSSEERPCVGSTPPMAQTYTMGCTSELCCPKEVRINIDHVESQINRCGGSEMSSFLSTVQSAEFRFKVCSGPCGERSSMEPYGQLKKFIGLPHCCQPSAYEEVEYVYIDTTGNDQIGRSALMSASNCQCS